MSRENLRRASQHLEAAAEVSEGDARERLAEQAEEFARLADRDQGPDHGRLARHERTIADAAEDAPDEAAGHVDDAIEAIHAYRKTIEGV